MVSEIIRNAKEDTNLRIDPSLLLGNDFDPDFNNVVGAAALHITAVGQGTNGRAFLDATGHIIFTPDENFNGIAKFEYTITDETGLSTTGIAEVAVGAVNDGGYLPATLRAISCLLCRSNAISDGCSIRGADKIPSF